MKLGRNVTAVCFSLAVLVATPAKAEDFLPEDAVAALARLALYVKDCGGQLTKHTHDTANVVITIIGQAKFLTFMFREDAKRQAVGTGLFCDSVRENFAQFLVK